MIEPDGLFSHLTALFSAKLAYLRARLQLAGIEGKEAAILYAVVVGLAIAALMLWFWASPTVDRVRAPALKIVPSYWGSSVTVVR